MWQNTAIEYKYTSKKSTDRWTWNGVKFQILDYRPRHNIGNRFLKLVLSSQILFPCEILVLYTRFCTQCVPK